MSDDEAARAYAEKQLRRVDMLVSMHAELAQRNDSRAAALDLIVLTCSVILCATALLDPKVLPYFHATEQGARVILAVGGIAVFALTLINLRVDWKARAGRHERAAAILAEIKARWRTALKNDPAHFGSERVEIERQYAYVAPTLPAIPESEFHRLKAKHKRKIALSRAIDERPSAPLVVLRFELWWRDTMVLHGFGKRPGQHDRVEVSR